MPRGKSRKAHSFSDHITSTPIVESGIVSSPNEFTSCPSRLLEDLSKEISSLTLVRELVRNSNEEDKQIVENIVAVLSDRRDAHSIFLQLEIAFYFDNVGNALRATTIAQEGVNSSLLLDDINLQRKAHNTAGILYSRVCDYERACLHLENALRLSRQIDNKCFELAVLCNVVSTLQVMGLLSEAKSLSIKLSERPGGTQEVDYLHLQNAINGMRLSSYMKDIDAASYFYNIATKKLTTVGPVSSNWKAYIDAYYSLSLLQRGEAQAAYSVISDAIRQRDSIENPRVGAILYCAFARCALEVRDKIKIDQLRNMLVSLLESSKSYALDHEDVLRTLVKLYEVDRSRQGQQAGLVYLRKLNDHLINVKHKQFFDRISCDAMRSRASEDKIRGPSYWLPSSLATAALDDSCQAQCPSRLYASNNDRVRKKGLRFITASRRKLEVFFRSEDFEVAEDWAVAADFAADRQGGHCFEVGALARQLALQLEFDANRSMLIEMACRLHDIGKLAVDAELQRLVNTGLLNDYLSIVEHSNAGARLLASSSDVVLQLASHVARHHHEWWNGCGLPHGLAGEAIPIEARICSIADAYVSLLNPPKPQTGWDRETAVQQVIAMAGVQLDPNLIAPFLIAVDVYNDSMVNAEEIQKPFQVNALNIAKQQLLKSVKLLS